MVAVLSSAPADPGPDGSPTIETVLAELRADERLVHHVRFDPRPAAFAELAKPLPDAVRKALGVEDLWSHQARAIDLLRRGRSVVVATGTGSGKSLCYQAVVAEAALAPVRSRTSLLLFPTKALAQDQARAFHQLGLRRLVAATYDGDASNEARAWVRNRANVVLTNPEMVHHGILPHHARWASFLARLDYVVIDELHVLRGIFGSHVAHVLRRLRRLCAHYGSDPTFVFTSATIGEPAALAESLCGIPVEPVTDDGSPRGERHFLLWNPPVLEEQARRGSANQESAHLAATFIRAGRRTIVFCRSRRGTELLALDLRRRLRGTRPPSRVRPYRGGYLAEERREIEHQLFSGQLDGVVATSALELGVDISTLDACVLTGFPGTISSMWQQSGRAGRARQASLAVLVAGDDQLDQWLMRHPTELFTRPPEPAVVNPGNPFVLLPHLECAASELPITPADQRFWPDHLDDGIRRLVQQDRLSVRRRGWGRRSEPIAAWTGAGWPSQQVSLRSSSRGEITILDDHDERRVGTVDGARAAQLIHPGAIYLHQGATYEVIDLDLGTRQARVRPVDGDTYTVARTSVSFDILRTDRTQQVGAATLSLGALSVRTQVTGYQSFDTRSRASLGVTGLDLPPSILETRGVWYTFDEGVLARSAVARDALPGGLHALEHAAIGMLPLFTICDRWDVGGVSTALHRDLGCPAVTIYDAFQGGAGVAELAYEAADRHLDATLDVIRGCGCASGCPSCVQSPKCGNGNEPLDKGAAEALLATVLQL